VKKIYVGNISFNTSEDILRSTFSQYGTVETVDMVRDRDTGQPRGFAFVEMTNDSEAQSAIDALNGQTLDGRPLTVNEARPKADRAGGGGRGGFGGGGGRGGFGGGGGRGGYGGGGGGNRGGGGRDRGPRW